MKLSGNLDMTLEQLYAKLQRSSLTYVDIFTNPNPNLALFCHFSEFELQDGPLLGVDTWYRSETSHTVAQGL